MYFFILQNGEIGISGFSTCKMIGFCVVRRDFGGRPSRVFVPESETGRETF